MWIKTIKASESINKTVMSSWPAEPRAKSAAVYVLHSPIILHDRQ